MRLTLNPSAGFFRIQESRRYYIGLTPKNKLRFYNFTIFDKCDAVKKKLERFVKTVSVNAYTPQEARIKARQEFGLSPSRA